ncbi:MAG: DUF2336 domain-containing protein [Brevundimonas sp.]|uniref:DUF2336 domain-containing protein n=1 Tax=Brevundimonas sp. TaxID=1871086 RepID=UPI0030010A65
MTAVALEDTSPFPSSDTGASDLLTLARSRALEDRQRLLMGVMALCDQHPATSQDLSPVLTDIFLVLARQAEHDIRKALSERLATAPWAPSALVNILALDDIEIARPILSRSPILNDEDLLAVLVQASLEHQIEVARRPNLSARVADAILDQAHPAPLTALAGNTTAEISAEGLRRLVEHSRRLAALRAPLARHPRLDESMARQLYSWIGTALRESMAERFAITDIRLDDAVDDAVQSAFSSLGRGPTPAAVEADRDEMDRRLVQKLQAAGQLRPGYLIRAIREKKLGLFQHALVVLGGFTMAQVRACMTQNSPEALYYACAAVGIDRAVFPPLLYEIRQLNSGAPGDAGNATWLRGGLSPQSAARALHALIGDGTPPAA